MSAKKPVIGITSSVEDVTAGPWEFNAVNSPRTYVDAVHRAGGIAVLLVADPAEPEDAGPILDRVDGIVISGGAGDVDPALYGEERHPATQPDTAGRDAFEGALLRGATERGIPVLGICRGMQLITATLGGRLHQHLPDVVGHDEHRALPAGYSEHEVELDPGSLAARAAGAERVRVCSHHHQGVADAGPRLRVTGRAAGDGTIEAVEDPQAAFVLGVLWHPEEDESSRVVSALVEAARG